MLQKDIGGKNRNLRRRGEGRKLAEAHWQILYRAAVIEVKYQSLRPLLTEISMKWDQVSVDI